MKKLYTLLFSLLITSTAFAQLSTAWTAPDSAKNVAKPGAGPSPAWTITNPLVHSGTAFTNSPINSGFINNVSDYLYFHDFDFAIPTGATITGVEVIASRGACNNGDYYRDTISLAHNDMAIGNYVEDSTNGTTAVDTLGGSSDMWGNVLTPAMVNSNSFGVFFSFHSFGICTFGVFDCRVKVHYTTTTGINSVSVSDRMILSPNPASTVLNVQAASPSGYTITDCMGKVVLQADGVNAVEDIDVSSLASGLYYIRSGNKVDKFIKR